MLIAILVFSILSFLTLFAIFGKLDEMYKLQKKSAELQLAQAEVFMGSLTKTPGK